MVKLTTNRGTALKNALGVFGHGLSPEAQIAQEQRLQLAGPTTVLVTKRGNCNNADQRYPCCFTTFFKRTKNNHKQRHLNSDPLNFSFFQKQYFSRL